MEHDQRTNPVLCVDNDENLLRMLRTYLEDYGYSVLTESQGHAAIRIATSALPLYAVVLDYLLPDISGGEVCAEIRRRKPEVPIIMFSGSLDTIPEQAGCTFDCLLTKDQGIEALRAVLDRMDRLPRPQPRPVRRFPRYPVQLPIVLDTVREGQTSVLRGTALTLGEGGLGGRLDGELTPGETVSILMADTELLSVRAQVRYRAAEVYGFEFIDTDPAQQLAIRSSCARLAASRSGSYQA